MDTQTVAGIQIALDAREFHPGDEVTGTVILPFDEKARSARIELREENRYNVAYTPSTPGGMLLHYYTGDAANCDAATDYKVRSAMELPASMGEQKFNLTLPAQAPPTAIDKENPELLRELVT
jgi:hypothetical protein